LYIYSYTVIQLFIHLYIYTFIHLFIYTSSLLGREDHDHQSNTYIHLYICTFRHLYSYTVIHLHLYSYLYICTFIQLYSYLYIYTFIHFIHRVCWGVSFLHLLAPVGPDLLLNNGLPGSAQQAAGQFQCRPRRRRNRPPLNCRLRRHISCHLLRQDHLLFDLSRREEHQVNRRLLPIHPCRLHYRCLLGRQLSRATPRG
jgi:hypothetical protein